MDWRRAIFPWSRPPTHGEFDGVPAPWEHTRETRERWEERHAVGLPVDGCPCWSCDGHRRAQQEPEAPGTG